MKPKQTIVIYYLLLACIMLNSSFCIASNLGNETDQLALLEFKSLIADNPNEILSSWNESRHHCQWPGVTCGHKHQRVTSLNLHGQNLLGSISPHIGNLSFLKNITLSNNRFYGEIPQEIGQLYRLRQLNMSNNTLGESIPFSLSNCTDLTMLDLGGNKLVGEIHASLGSLNKLVEFVLEKNFLKGEIPKSFGNLSFLQLFTVASNNLQGSIPNEIGELRSLTIFSVSTSNLSGIVPVSLYNISSLEKISLSGNRLTGSLPSDFGSSLPSLNLLYMGGNQFTGKIPPSLRNASQLQQIDISKNSFIGQVPNSIRLLSDLQLFNVEINKLGGNPLQDFNFLLPLSNCTDLEWLSFEGNYLSGQLPGSIANLSSQMTAICMGGNEIYGPMPEGLGRYANLFILGMENNHFSGVIPRSIGQLKTLQGLDLSHNQISDQIPDTLGNISRLSELFLSNNRLEGSIPESLGNCQYIYILDLSNNNLVGEIPSQVIGISLRKLNLSQNSLSGPLPTQIGKLISINSLDASWNNLSGRIPTSIGYCLSLETLDLHKNSFQGIIPSTLASLKGIQYLDLSRNKLSGEIPVELGSLTYLQYLNLSFNVLEGEIPTKGVFGNASAISLLGNDKLCGGMLELGQPLCKTQDNRKHMKAHAFKLITVLVCVIFFLTALSSFGVLYCKRYMRPDSAPASLREDKLMRVSYWELYRATNGFSLENLIGSGSFGSVYKGKLNQQESTLVAVKVLNLKNSRAPKSFLSECKILRSIRHRNLLKILTYCSSIDSKRNEFKALIYEFMSNGNLDMWLHPDEANSSRALSLLQRLNIAIDVASALHYLHSQCEVPIIHCDLKPSNILLNDDMSAQVGDFGLARFHPKANCDMLELSSIGLKGTVGYAAPEYGTGDMVSTCGDIYSYGVILLEMMTGRRPTDAIFQDDLNLHNYVEKAFPRHVNQIMDPLIYRQEQVVRVEEEELDENNDEIVEMEEHFDEIVEMEEHGRNIASSSHGENLKTCIMSILTIGLACSQESPTQRMDLNDVNKELHHVKGVFLGCGRNGFDH